jgi:hypothetical protein
MIRLGVIGETIGLSEGWENCLAWNQLGRGPENVSLAAAIDLGNLSGRATGSVDHPSIKDADGSVLKIPNGEPDLTKPGVILPRASSQSSSSQTTTASRSRCTGTIGPLSIAFALLGFR